MELADAADHRRRPVRGRDRDRLHNGLLATIGLDGAAYFYSNPLRQVAGLPLPLPRPGDTAIDPVPAPPPSDERLREQWISCFCCPPNIARTLAELPYFVYGVGPRDVWVHQYAATRLDVTLGDVVVSVEQRTSFPELGTVALALASSGDVALHLRIPAWAHGASSA